MQAVQCPMSRFKKALTSEWMASAQLHGVQDNGPRGCREDDRACDSRYHPELPRPMFIQ
jgi:hypothetical protein